MRGRCEHVGGGRRGVLEVLRAVGHETRLASSKGAAEEGVLEGHLADKRGVRGAGGRQVAGVAAGALAEG